MEDIKQKKKQTKPKKETNPKQPKEPKVKQTKPKRTQIPKQTTQMKKMNEMNEINQTQMKQFNQMNNTQPINLNQITSLKEYNINHLSSLSHHANQFFVNQRNKDIEKTLITLFTYACIECEKNETNIKNDVCISSPQAKNKTITLDDVFNKAYFIVSNAFQMSQKPDCKVLFQSIYPLVKEYKLSQ